MDQKRLLDALIQHEHLMARLYREMAEQLPAKHELLMGLSQEEETHAGMFVSIRDALLPSAVLTENDITVTLEQLERQRSAVEKVIVSLKDGSFEEREIVNVLLDLELSAAELQINRVIVEHKDEPGLKTFVEILDNEKAHNQVLEEWLSDVP